MPAASFRLRLHQAVAALAAVIIAATAFAYFGALEIDRAALRSSNAQATLAAHITISNSAYNLFKQMSDAALLNELVEDDWEKRLIAIVRRDIANARRAIVAEVKELADREDETEELERLASIEAEIDSIVAEYDRIQAGWSSARPRESRRQIAALLDTRIDLTFNKMISAAIAEERREVETANARLAAASSAIRVGVIGIALVSGPIVFLVLAYVNRTLLGSLRALSQGAEAYGRGDFNHEIAALQSAEFESIRHRLAIMASELAKARQSAEASRERLEREVAARTEDLAEANRRLEEAAEARRNFFADVSHELRTPLTVIRGEAEIALRGGERRAADYRDSLARIVEQSSMMGRMVEDLLFIARADAGEPRMEMRSVAVGTLLSDIAASFEALATAHEVRISRSCGDNGAVVLGDRDRLAQVLGVLIDNAIRYSRKGGEVRLSSSIDDDKAVISVVDDGIGISPDDFGRVFDRFYRGENAKDHSAAGVGLGLSVAKAIIEAHNGHIRLAPSSSGGVAASIALPIETKLRAIS